MANQTLPTFDYESMIALQKANVETVVQAQQIMFDLMQTIIKRNTETAQDVFTKSEALVTNFDAKKQPQDYMDDAKAAVEKTLSGVKETMDLSMRAQQEVVDLLVKRASTNIEETKSVAA